MCGIVGYIGSKEAESILIEGLKRLEYRGYDSAGLATINDTGLQVQRAPGRISGLESLLERSRSAGSLGIGHTRWATHGGPTEANAHPHTDNSGRIALVHNGIIENYASLKQFLTDHGSTFGSDTDTEVLAHLIGHFYRGNLETAVQTALKQVQGTYGIAVVCVEEPEKLVIARKGSPLIIGVGDKEYLVASDASAIIEHTTQVVYLADNEMAVLERDGFRTLTLDNVPVSKEVEECEFSLEQIALGEYEHFMAKEIAEQPTSFSDTMRGRIDLRDGRVILGGIQNFTRELIRARRIILTACGTAWHAALVGEFLLEDLAKLPTEVEYASEFRYRNPIIEDGTIVIAISQSGETADTLAALREARERGAISIGIVNQVGSTIAREADGGIYLHCGPEIGVASTKAFTSQLITLTMLALFIGRRKYLSQQVLNDFLREMEALPSKVSRILEQSQAIRDVASKLIGFENWLFLGRGYNYPVALEGALKLKEISYIHAEGLPAAEMKHGPIALITNGTPAVFVASRGSQYDKIISNIEEVRARGGTVIAVATEGDDSIHNYADHVFEVPATLEPLQPLLTVIPLQLLAYHAAVLRGCNVDKPRNLAKSVTVE